MSLVHAVGYLRVSTDEQSSGIETQKAVINQYIDELEAKDPSVQRYISKFFIDENVSGDSDPEFRTGFKNLLDYIHKNKQTNNSVNEVWVQTRDRLSRDIDYLGHITILLKRENIQICAVDDDKEEIVRRVKDILGAEELKKYREKAKEGRKRRIKEEKAMTRAPFGYKINVEGKLEIDEEKRLIVEQIFSMIEQGVRVKTIAERFNLSQSGIYYIRNNPIYRTGEVRWGGKVVYNVEPIISNEHD